jgi:hypothetical protein
MHSWEDLCEQFVNVFQGGYKFPETLNDLLALSQRPKETLRSFMQRFCQLAHGVVKPTMARSSQHLLPEFVKIDVLRSLESVSSPSLVSSMRSLTSVCERRKGG